MCEHLGTSVIDGFIDRSLMSFMEHVDTDNGGKQTWRHVSNKQLYLKKEYFSFKVRKIEMLRIIKGKKRYLE